MLGHLDPAFLAVMDETLRAAAPGVGHDQRRTLPLSATGSAGMEASFVNTVHEGDVVVVAVNGLFGQRMCDVAARCGAEVVAVEHEWGTRSTSTGCSRPSLARDHRRGARGDLHGRALDIAALGAGKGDALLVTDAVTSIGGIELRADDWGVDVGTRAPRSASAWRRVCSVHDQRPGLRARVEKPRSWYLDLGPLGGYVGEASGSGRTNDQTAPTLWCPCPVVRNAEGR